MDKVKKAASLTKGRRKIIKNHLDKKLSEFNTDIRQLALYNDHPYISTYLNSALWKMKESIARGFYYVADKDELYL